jgi:hypothetical protein
MGAQRQVDKLPLLGVSTDRLDHDGAVAVSVAQSGGGHLTHIIHDVTRIYIEQTDDGADAAMEIVSGDGTKTIVGSGLPRCPRPSMATFDDDQSAESVFRIDALQAFRPALHQSQETPAGPSIRIRVGAECGNQSRF